MRIPGNKTAVPHLPPDFVPRPALRDLLDSGAVPDIVLVSAPPGWGKSVLLADWAGRHGGEVAWVTVDGADNDPLRLWTAVRAALTADDLVPVYDRLRVAWPEGGGADLVDNVLAALEDLERPVWLVLDDLHEITGEAALRDLARFVRLRPDMLRLVLAGRVDPPLSLPRMRLEGRLQEVRAENLRFSAEDAAALLGKAGIALTGPQLDALVARTEGWVAGLRLATLALRRAVDTDRFLAEFSGDDRSVADYLTGEMLAGLDPSTLHFLRAVSVCARLYPELAATLSDRPDAGHVLDRLTEETALVSRHGRRGHRIHNLLRTYLGASLQRHSPVCFHALHGRAARWWADQGDTGHALGHAERADDVALLGELLRRFGVGMLLRGEFEQLDSALAAAGPPARAADPVLALLAAHVHLDMRKAAEAAAEIRQAWRVWPPAADATLAALRASAELITGTRAPEAGDDVSGLSGDGHDTDVLLHVARGIAVLLRGGDRAAARHGLERALAVARRDDLGHLEVQCLATLATMSTATGDGPAAAGSAREALTAAAHSGRRASSWSCAGAAVLAYAELLGGDPATAQAQVAAVLRIPDRITPDVGFALHGIHAAARSDLGDGVAAVTEARTARERYGDGPGPAQWFAALAVLEHRTAVMVGHQGIAASVLGWLEQRCGPIGEGLLMRAWQESAAGHHDVAAAVTAPLRDGRTAAILPQTVVEVELLRAEAALRGGDRYAGRAAVAAALARARPLDAVRPFALAGDAARELLRVLVARPGKDAFRARLGAAMATIRPEVTAPLSEREGAVLELLPSLLSAREIAAELMVSVNTVKTHVRAIYAKLGVANRRDAVWRARERGLLP